MDGLGFGQGIIPILKMLASLALAAYLYTLFAPHLKTLFSKTRPPDLRSKDLKARYDAHDDGSDDLGLSLHDALNPVGPPPQAEDDYLLPGIEHPRQDA